MKKTIAKLSIFMFILTNLICSSLFRVYADNDIQINTTNDSNMLAFEYWFNHGCKDFTLYNADGTSTTYTGTINNAQHTINNASTNINTPYLEIVPSSSSSSSSSTTTSSSRLVWDNLDDGYTYVGRTQAVGSQQVTYIGDKISSISYPSQRLYLGNATITNTTTTSSSGSNIGYNIQAKQLGIESYNSTVNAFNSTLQNFSSSEPNSLKSIVSNNFISGYTTNNSYNSSRRIYLNSNSDYYIAFFVDKNIQVSDLKIYSTSGLTSDVTVTRNQLISGGYYKVTFIFNSVNSGSYSIEWGLNSNNKIRPIFNGQRNIMTDEIAQFIAVDTTTETELKTLNTNVVNFKNANHNDMVTNHNDLVKLDNDTLAFKTANHNDLTTINNTLQHGNNSTSSLTNSNDNVTNSMNTTENQMHNIETSNLNNLSNKLDSIDITTNKDNLYNIQGFTDSIWFIRAVFNNLINRDTTNALRYMITFSLTLGLALTIIGKLRN